MPTHNPPRLVRWFLRVLRARQAILVAFSILTAAGIHGALRIPTDSSIDRLVVAGDPVSQATVEFERVFPEGEQALLLLEAPDPFAPDVLTGAEALEQALDRIPDVSAQSLLTLRPRAGASGVMGPDEAAHVRTFATGTTLFRRAGLVGTHFLGIALELHVNTPAGRDRALAAIDALVLPLDRAGHPFSAVRRVGSPWLDAWLEQQTGAATRKFMPLFGLFLIALVLLVYRSWRTLCAIALTLGAVLAIAMGLAELFGWSNTLVSTIVPLTVLVTTTATLVYLHARYMEPDDAPSLYEHQARALSNKFLPCTASMFATAVGFAALAVSDIRPVREMGLWTACGLLVAWMSCFTLFPALQSLLRTPMRSEATPPAGTSPRSSTY